MMNLFTDELRRNPYPIYAQMRSKSPVLHLAPLDVWMIFDYENVKRALNDPEVFSSVIPGPEWLIFLDPPRQTKLRALVTRAFTPKAVTNLEPRIRELSRELLDVSVGRGEMDLATDYSVLLPMRVIAEMLGIPLVDRDHFIRWSNAILNLSQDLMKDEDGGRAVQAYRDVTEEMNAYLTGLLEERRANPKEDMLSQLLAAEVDGDRLTQQEILMFFQLLLVAGQETTTNLINNAILCFIENPDQLALLNENRGLLPSAIEEVLRYRSPFQWTLRRTKRETQVSGQTIPADKMVLVVIGSANHDPKHFADADRFDITRDPNPHLAFGLGLHFCLGAPLARLEARIALTDLLDRVKEIRLASAEPWEPRKALHVHGPTKLPIRFTPADAVV